MITVIVPAYNASAFLAECLDSILLQNPGEEVQTIVIDDGSTDSTAAIAARYSGITLVSTPNRGLSAARNEGMLRAQGEWITFVDADDRLLPGALAAMLRVAAASGADVVTGTFTCDKPHLKATYAEPVTTYGRTALINTLYQDRCWNNSAWAKLYRADAVRHTRFTPGLTYEDLDYIARLYLQPGLRVASVDSPLYYYRQHPSSITHRMTPSRLDVLKVTEAIETRSADDPQLLMAARSRRLSACFNMYMLTRGRKEYKEANTLCRREIIRLRRPLLTAPRMRLKNKLAVILSYICWWW